MHRRLSTHHLIRSFLTAVALFAGGQQAFGEDVFTAPNSLTVPALRIGNATYSNVALTLSSIVSPPSGKSPKGAEDTYDPATRLLTVPAVRVGQKTYFNVVLSVAHLTSIGSVSGSDTYDGSQLTIPYMLIGTTPYYNVQLPVSLANVGKIYGGLPRVTFDEYDPLRRKLTLPVVLVGGNIYTNVILHVGPNNFDFVGVTEAVLYSFQARSTDGIHPQGSLIQAADGNFYGMAGGGVNGFGAVIKVTPDGAESVLYSFGTGLTDGMYPTGNLIQASDGNFYGMTQNGGGVGWGTVFKVTPTGNETVLYTFGLPGSGDGFDPFGSLVQGADGNFYAMTFDGGQYGAGAVVKITPAGDESVLHSFGAFAGDGMRPEGSLIQASDGNFYGMTSLGGANGCGAVIKITPAGSESVFHSFAFTNDGFYPDGDLIEGTDGSFYGMTGSGGAIEVGAVIKITPEGVESVLYSLGSQSEDGWNPVGSLVEASDGSFYGMTTGGGRSGNGAVIRVTPAGEESVLHSFTGMGSGDGYQPRGNLMQARDGNLYGMTGPGGANGEGAVIKLTW